MKVNFADYVDNCIGRPGMFTIVGGDKLIT